MSDTKKPTLSEIRARRKQTDVIYESRAKFPHLLPGPSQMDKDNIYLLNLVKRMGGALGRFSSEFPGPGCGYCTIAIEPDGKVTHEVNCPIPEARALLEELKK